jgi:2-methylcitrate dehydratase PrpD
MAGIDVASGAIEARVAGVAVGEGSWSARAHELARLAIDDTLAIGIGGSLSRQATLVRATLLPYEKISDAGGSRPSHTGAEVTVPLAPLWNDPAHFSVVDAALFAGTAAHSLDWDDYMHPMHGHVSAVLLGTLWPLAEALEASGDALIDAFLAGYQVDWLTSLALSHAHYRRGWHATSTVGSIGAAAAAARLLGLDAGQAGVALGIASTMASGLRAHFGTTTKALHGGLAARNGVHAALLARAGATAGSSWLLGPSGMVNTMGAEHEPEQAATEILDGLAAGSHGIETDWGLVQKPYACCGSIHSAVDALLEILDRENIATADIRSVTVHVDPLVLGIMRHQRPSDEQQARYSPSWVMAAASLDRAAGPAQFSAGAVERSEIHDFRESRVRVVDDLVVGDHDRYAGRVEVALADRTVEAYMAHASGHPLNPMNAAQRRAKQRAAITLVMPDVAADRLIGALDALKGTPVQVLGNLVRACLGVE